MSRAARRRRSRRGPVEIKNRLGATFSKETLIWRGEDVKITASNYRRDLKECGVSVTTKLYRDRIAEIELKRNKSAVAAL